MTMAVIGQHEDEFLGRGNLQVHIGADQATERVHRRGVGKVGGGLGFHGSRTNLVTAANSNPGCAAPPNM